MILNRLVHPSATAALLLAAFLSACGGEGSDSGSTLTVPEGFDACTILTPERARAVAGKPIAGITSTLEDAQGRGPLYCPYNAGTIEQPELVGLEIRPFASPRVAESRMDAARPYLERLSKKTIQEVQGLGDEAYWVPGLQQLHTRKGSVLIVATVQSSQKPLDDAQSIAQDTFAALEKAAAEAAKGKTAA
jgi:hypothetical protein